MITSPSCHLLGGGGSRTLSPSMTDWVTISSLATAAGTLVLAIATFGAVRSSNRSARLAEQAFLMGQRPLVMPSRLDDPSEKLMWGDEHWAHVEGGRGSVELVDDNIYLAMSLRNAGNGIAVLQGWRAQRRLLDLDRQASAPEEFRPQLRDLYVGSGDIGFWQAAIRDPNDSDYGWLRDAIAGRSIFLIELLYSDHQAASGRWGSSRSRPARTTTGVLRRPPLEPGPSEPALTHERRTQ
jgi:hypothetical protein